MKKIDVVYSVLSALLISSSLFLFRRLSISTKEAFSFSSHFPVIFMNYSASQGFLSAVVSVFADLFQFLIPFIPLSVGFAVLVLYGMREGENRKIALISTLVPALLSFLILGFTPVVLFFSISLVASGLLVTTMGEAFPKELEKMENFRSGSRAVSNVFLIVILLLTLGVFLQVGSNLEIYKSDYVNATEKMAGTVLSPVSTNMSSLSDQELIQQFPETYQKELESMPEEQRQKVLQEKREEISSQSENVAVDGKEAIVNQMTGSEGFLSLIDFYIFLTIIAVPSVLFFFRTIFFAPLAGLVTLLGNLK